MSNELVTRLYRTTLGDPVLKAILVSLADQANDHGFCWPCIETIARRTEYSVRSIKAKLRDAERIGLLRIRMRHDRSSQYLFNIDRLPMGEDAPRPAKETGPWEEEFREQKRGAGDAPDLFSGVQEMSGRGAGDSIRGAGDAPITSIEPSLEPSLVLLAADAPTSSITKAIVDRWNELATKHPTMTSIASYDPARAAMMVERAKKSIGGPAGYKTVGEVWTAVFEAFERSKFLRGLAPPGPGRNKPFRATLTWALTAANFVKILDGAYDDERDARGNNITGTARTGPTASAVSGARAMFQAHGGRGSGRGNQGKDERADGGDIQRRIGGG